MNRIIFVISILIAIPSLAATQKDSILMMIPQAGEVYRHGYSELSADDKARYDYIVQTIAQFDANNAAPYQYHAVELKSLTIANNDVTVMMNHLSRIINDVPELYIISSQVPRWNTSPFYFIARVLYLYTPSMYLEQLKQMDAAYKEISSTVTPQMSDYEKLLTLHDRYAAWVNYGDVSGGYAGNARGALINRRAVCEGFARGFLYICQRAGIKCIYVAGQLCTSTTDNTWGNHAWNYVELNGKWYLVDVTADGSFANTVGHVGFLRGQDYFSKNYKLTYYNGSDANLNGVYKSLPTLSETTYDPNTDNVDMPMVEQKEVKGKSYDLSGRTVGASKHGIVIRNGRKYIGK